MRKRMVAANWKMNMTSTEGKEFVSKIKNKINVTDKDVVICPPFTCLKNVYDEIKDTNISLGAQNFYYEDKGAFTGEVSLDMLINENVKYVIIGHSERRQIFKEEDDLINKKVLKALSKNMKVILCCGETLEQREKNETLDFIKYQLENDLKNVNIEDTKNITIAYEPIWAIGTGKTATSEEAEEVCSYIRNIIKSIFNSDIADNMQILYGGSVKEKNAKELFNKENIDGGLIGGASLTEEFINIVNS